MTIKKDIKILFKNSVEEYPIEAIALTSKNGIPIASQVKKDKERESFSTLSATILGASEVIFSAFEKDQPEDILIKSKDSLLLIKETTHDSVLALMGKLKDKDELNEVINEISYEVEKIRGKSSKTEVTR